MALGLDLGNFSIKLASNNPYNFSSCLNSVILDHESNYILAIDQNNLGQFDRLGKTKKQQKCFEDSKILDFEAALFLLNMLITPLRKKMFWRLNTVVIAIGDNSELENMSLTNLFKSLNLGKITFVDRDYARARGLGLKIKENNTMISFDLGYQTSRLSIVNNLGIVTATNLDTSAENLINLISQHLLYEHRLEIANSTIEYEIINGNNKNLSLTGKDADTRLPKKLKINFSELQAILGNRLEIVANSINNFLKSQDSAINGDKIEYFLVGGIFANPYFSRELKKKLKYPFNVAKSPEKITALGCLKIARTSQIKFKNRFF